MNKIQDHIKILSTLSLASSDTREDTLASVIIRTIELSENGVSKKLLGKIIEEHFQFEPYKTEIDIITAKLIEDGEVCLKKNDLLFLSKEKVAAVKSSDLKLTDSDKKRFQNFKAFIQDDLESKIETTDIKLLWRHFLNYLYNCFFEYGQEALKTLHPHIKFEKDEAFENVTVRAINQLKEEREELGDIFEKAIELFPNYASEEDVAFLVELSQKTSSFSSLGIDPSLLSTGLEKEIIDWTLYLDTNVLYSLLDLHTHPETEATKALIQLIHENTETIKIHLRYSEFTYRELKNKQKDFALLDAKMSSPAINALLKSGKVDSFSEQFYRKLLDDPNTLHPSDVVELSQTELNANKIKIGRNKKRVEKLGEKYINAQISDYFKYIDDRNAFKEKFCKEKGIWFHPVFKSEGQVRHDVILREILRDSRKIKEGKVLTMNNVKYFGLTLDSMLISFDRSQTKEYHDEDTYPIFFRPSFLLDRLIRILPVQTNDYKKAFFKAITTKGFHRNEKKSRDILKLANYLKQIGIDNTDVIYNIISEDLFLDKLNVGQNSEDFNQGEFISSEINRQFEEAQKKLQEANTVLENNIEKRQLTETQNKKLIKNQQEAQTLVKQYEIAVNTLQQKIKKVERQSSYVTQSIIDFEAASERQVLTDENFKLKQELKSQIEENIEDYKDEQLRKWQKQVWWHLFWAVPIVIFSLLILIPNPLFHLPETDANKRLLDNILKITGVLLTLFFFGLVRYRFLNEEAKSKRRDRVRIPKELKDELKKYEK